MSKSGNPRPNSSLNKEGGWDPRQCGAAAVIAESAARSRRGDKDRSFANSTFLDPDTANFQMVEMVSAHFMWHLVGIMNKCNTTAL